MKIISLGWGVQSFALAAMSALGVLPPVDAAVHADTTHERSETYAFAERWTPWLEARGVKVVTVWGRRTGSVEKWHTKGVMIPAYTTYDDGTPSGVLRRQCTHDWKIAPIRHWLQKHRDGQKVEQWLGITLDEVQRMKPSRVKYIVNRHPFIDMLDHPWRRGEVIQWLHDNDLDIPVKSSCTFCPYHDNATWREMQLSGNGDWTNAVKVDKTIRNKRPGYTAYVARQRQPLEDIDFRSEEEHGQLSLWDEECDGYCFL